MAKKLLFLFVLLLPTQLAYHFWPAQALVFGIRVDYLSPAIYLTDLVFLLLLFLDRPKKIKPAKIATFFFLYLLFSTLFVASNQVAAFYKLLKITELFFLASYIAGRGLPLTPLSLAVIYTGLIAIVQFIFGQTIGGPFWFLGERSFDISTPGIALQEIGGQNFLRAYSTFSHPNSFAGFLLVSLILIWGQKTKLSKIALVLGGLAFVLTFSQAAWLAGLLVLGFLLLRKRLPAWIIFGALALVVSLLPLQLAAEGVRTEEVVKRQELSQAAFAMVVANPLFGVGPGNFVVRLPEFGATPNVSWFLQPVHNIFLLAAAETGLAGLAFLFWFLKLIAQKLKTVSWQLQIVLLAILLTGSLDHYWLTLQQNQLLLAAVLGLQFYPKKE